MTNDNVHSETSSASRAPSALGLDAIKSIGCKDAFSAHVLADGTRIEDAGVGDQLPRSNAAKRLLLLPAILVAAACTSAVKAPTDGGMCFRMYTTGEEYTFRPIGSGVDNLESCAAQLEGARLIERRSVVGAYQGHFIFADDQQITAANSLTGNRIRIFEADVRVEVQKGLRRLIAEREAETSSGRGAVGVTVATDGPAESAATPAPGSAE